MAEPTNTQAVGNEALSASAAATFIERLRKSRTRRVKLEDLWIVYREVFGNQIEGIDARRELLTALRHAALAGGLTLPVEPGLGWDRTSQVALPKWAVLTAALPGATRSGAWRHFPWRPELQWIVDLTTLTGEQELFVHAVQRGLVEGWFADRAPLKYRSLQLTGSEKQLEKWLGSQLFGPGRLTLDLLGCDGPWLPLTWEAVGFSANMIVFENAGSYLVARRVLAAIPQPPYGMVAYGSGNQVLRSVPYLKEMSRPIAQIDYVGDLDIEGLRMGSEFADRVRAAKGPAVCPAATVYQAMLEGAAELGHANGWPCHATQRAGSSWLSALNSHVRSKIECLLSSGRRIPEEVLDDQRLRRLWGG